MNATMREGRWLPPLLRAAYPRHTAKLVAQAADVPHETARNWTKGKCAPSADVLLRMAMRCERMAAALEDWGARHDGKDRRGAAAGSGDMAAVAASAAPVVTP
jgi:hypothetical protein